MSNPIRLTSDAVTRVASNRSRRALRMSTILGGGLLALAGLTATPAAAQDECGAAPIGGGTVTCTPAGNDYPNGVFYLTFSDPLTVILQDGVNIDTSGGLNPGVLLFGLGDASFDLQGMGASITTDADGGFGILAASDTGDINLSIGTVTTTGTNAIGIIGSSAEGAITVDAGTVSTTGDGADGIQGTTNLGDIDLQAFTVTTTGAGANGLFADSDNGDIRAVVSTVITEGDGSIGVSADTTFGDITIGDGGDAIITSGANSDAVNARTAVGDIAVDVFQAQTTGANSDAIEVVSTSGAVTVNATAVTADGDGARGIVATGESVAVTQDGFFIGTGGNNANAIQVRARNGDASVSTGNAFTGGDTSAVIDISSQAGAVTVNAGSLTTSGDSSVGVRASSGTAGNLFFGIPAAPGGTVDITAASVRTSGANSTGIVTNALFGADTRIAASEVLTQGDGASGVVATSALGGDIDITAGRITTAGLGADGIQAVNTGAGLITLNTTGAIASAQGTGIMLDSGSTASLTVGEDSSVNGGLGGVNILSVDGTTVANAGTIGSTGGFALNVDGGAASVVNSGVVNGRIDLTDNADTFSNGAGGRFNAVGTSDFGAGADSFANAGVLTAFSSASFTGLESFNNTGLIDLRDGATGDILTLSGTSFTGGAGSQVGLDVSFATNTADRLVIGSAAGTTTLLLNDATPGVAPTLNLDGILLVDATTATAGNFQLGGNTDFGFTRADLVFDGATSNFLLVTAPDTEVFEIGRLQAGVTNGWNQSGDAWSARMTELRDVAWSGLEERADGFEMWAQGYAGTEGQDLVRSFNPGGTPTTVDLSYDQEFQGFQLGGDVQRSMGSARMVFGLTGGLSRSDLEFASSNSITFEGGNIGAYAALTAGGFFLNGLVKADRFEATVFSQTALVREEIDGMSYGAKGEIGYHLNLGNFFVEPVATLAYVDTDLDDLTVPGGVFTFDDGQSLRGEAGVRVGGDFAFGSSRIQPFVGVFAVEEFEGQNTAVFTSGATAFGLQDIEPDTYGKVSLGMNLLGQDGVNLFIRGDAAFSGEAKGGSLRIGARWSF
ncbi:MAG: autotransporter outer membrane beta-barrel domain-containing protein [Brevundimonas sp.]